MQFETQRHFNVKNVGQQEVLIFGWSPHPHEIEILGRGIPKPPT